MTLAYEYMAIKITVLEKKQIDQNITFTKPSPKT